MVGPLLSCRSDSAPTADGFSFRTRTEGTIVASTSGLPQITPITLTGARGSDRLQELPVPDHVRDPGRFPGGPPGNVGRAYQHMGQAIRAGRSFSPDFAHARRVHKLLDRIQQSSDEGISVSDG